MSLMLNSNSDDSETLYSDSVFSTYLYTGNGSTQTITNGIDLAGKGGLVWGKTRSVADDNDLIDTVRGRGYSSSSNLTSAQVTCPTPNDITSFNSNGFSLGSTYGANLNENGVNFVSWTFRKAAKFFDVVTYTGTGSARTIAHSLGVAPGMVIVKRTDTTGNWQVYSNGLTSAAYSIQLNLTDAQASAPTVWNSTAPTSSVFSVGTDATVNASGGTYVAYLYAHDTSSTGIIQCGSYTGNGSINGPTVNLGWELQYVMIKNASATGNNWLVIDNMRGMPQPPSNDAILSPNTANAENNNNVLGVTATGFYAYGGNSDVNSSGATYIYMAIRRPNKPPTSGTQVFSPNLSSSGTGTQITTGFPVDAQISKVTTGGNNQIYDRLRGVTSTTTQSAQYLVTNLTDTEHTTTVDVRAWNNTGFQLASGLSGVPVVYWNFKRAPGFFDEVCYTGDGRATENVAHNLQTIPELVITKRRDSPQYWFVDIPNGHNKTGQLHLSDAWFQNWSSNPAEWYVATSTTVRKAIDVSGGTYVAYLFATLAGISKVGSYTGNGTGQAIACGFSAGARFVLIKRTDAAGDWYTFDSARGLTVGSSPYLLLNSTAAETTGDNGVYASPGGFTLGSTASTTTNINAATYIFLAIS